MLIPDGQGGTFTLTPSASSDFILNHATFEQENPTIIVNLAVPVTSTNNAEQPVLVKIADNQTSLILPDDTEQTVVYNTGIRTAILTLDGSALTMVATTDLGPSNIRTTETRVLELAPGPVDDVAAFNTKLQTALGTPFPGSVLQFAVSGNTISIHSNLASGNLVEDLALLSNHRERN